MRESDVEHHTEIRRTTRTTPLWIALVALAVVITMLVGSSDDGADDEEGLAPPTSLPSTPTSETLTTTSPPSAPPVFGITDSGGDVRPISTGMDAAPSGVEAGMELGRSGPIATAGRVVVLDRSGTLHTGEPGRSFQAGPCCFEEIHPANEPAHVWVRVGEQVELLDLRDADADRRVVLAVGDATVLGPASFGVVTTDERNVVRWHRPSFEPEVVRLPEDRRAIDSGGERLLVSAPATTEHGVRLEVWSTIGNGILTTHDVGEGAGGALAPDGSVVLVPAPGGSEVRDAATGLVLGWLPKVDGAVWVGGNRFAASLDGSLVVSDRGVVPLTWSVLAVAERSP